MPDMTYGGIAMAVNARGLVVWSDDWRSAFGLASDPAAPFELEHGGPETYGHTSLIYRGEV